MGKKGFVLSIPKIVKYEHLNDIVIQLSNVVCYSHVFITIVTCYETRLYKCS